MADSFFRYIEEDVEYVRVEGEVWTDPEYRFNYKLGIKRFTFECTVERFSGGYCNATLYREGESPIELSIPVEFDWFYNFPDEPEHDKLCRWEVMIEDYYDQNVLGIKPWEVE